MYRHFTSRFKAPWKLLSTGSVIFTWKEVHVKQLRSTSWLNCSAKPTWRSIKLRKWNIRLQRFGCLPYEPRNVQKNWVWSEWGDKISNKKSERDNRTATCVTVKSLKKRGTLWTTTWFFQNFKCDTAPSVATISGCGRYMSTYITCEKTKFGNFNRKANEKKIIQS